jgi:hypothetical protein
MMKKEQEKKKKKAPEQFANVQKEKAKRETKKIAQQAVESKVFPCFSTGFVFANPPSFAVSAPPHASLSPCLAAPARDSGGIQIDGLGSPESVCRVRWSGLGQDCGGRGRGRG